MNSQASLITKQLEWGGGQKNNGLYHLNDTAGLHKLLGDFGVEFILLIGVYTRLQDESMGKDLKCNFNH